MTMKAILNRKERKICDHLLKQETIIKIYENKKNAWLESFNYTKDLVEILGKTNKDPKPWTTRELIIKTSLFLSEMVDDFDEEVEKLNDRSPKDKKIYKDLNKLPIAELNNSKQKALFIMIGHIYENVANILK